MLDLKWKADPVIRPRNAVALLALATLAAIVAGLLLSSRIAQHRNEAEAIAEKFRITAAVRDLHANLVKDVTRLSREPDPSSPPVDIGSLDQVLVRNFDGVGPIAVLAGRQTESSDLNRAITAFTQNIVAGTARSAEGMIAPGDLFDVAALPLESSPSPDGGGAGRKILIGVRKIDATYVREIAEAARVSGLGLVQGVSDGGLESRTWSGGKDWRGFGLLWEPARPGDQFMLQWTVIIMGVTSAMAVTIILRARGEAGKLHESEARAIEASRNDWLSGLPNRVFFNHVLERDLKTLKHGKGKLALLYIDVDRFKDINDAFGLEAGDVMIQAVTRRIEAVLTEGQSLARFEGDAFSLVVPDLEEAADCEPFIETLQAAMQAPFDVGGASIALSVSIGIAIAPDDATERAELIRLANLALYRAKRDGRNRATFYKEDLHQEWRRRILIERALREAIEHGGLVLRYQPIVEEATGRVVCAEALVRWNHASEGLIAPDVFIGLAEDRGLIVPLGEWVLREACTVATRWPQIRVAVNVSPIQFRQKDFVETVLRIVEATGLDPSRLELELTEGVLVDHEAEALAAMAALRARGIRFAIDDFGTGYSSLIYLRRFAVDKIKIDRAFIEAVEPDSDAEILLKSVVKLGRDLGLTVTAEGIETPAQRDFLGHIGCHELQGYLIARPLPEEEFTAFLGRQRQPALIGSAA